MSEGNAQMDFSRRIFMSAASQDQRQRRQQSEKSFTILSFASDAK
jgi:hypothetical protein